MSINIEIPAGSRKKLLTAGKYCEENIEVSSPEVEGAKPEIELNLGEITENGNQIHTPANGKVFNKVSFNVNVPQGEGGIEGLDDRLDDIIALQKSFIGDEPSDNEPELVPSEGLEMILSDDGSHYQVAGMGTCTDTDVVIPSEHNGLPVTAFYNGLAHGDFDGVFTDKNIVTLTVPDTINDFDKHCAVYYCTSLKELKLGSGCALEEWSIPGWFTIMGNSSLEKITVSEENPYLYADESGKHLFTKSNSLLISLDGSIPEGTVTICDYVFENGNPTTDGTVKIPASVTSLYSLWGDVMDFSEHTQVPTLNKPWGNAPQIIVPAALYGEWINATNWCEHADKITSA